MINQFASQLIRNNKPDLNKNMISPSDTTALASTLKGETQSKTEKLILKITLILMPVDFVDIYKGLYKLL